MVAIQYKQRSQMIIERKGIKFSKIDEVAKMRVSLDVKVADNGYDITYFQMRLGVIIGSRSFGGLI